MKTYWVPARRTRTETVLIPVEADDMDEALDEARENVKDDAVGGIEVTGIVEEQFDFDADSIQ